jgi:protoporphyrinogen/coproporphyrinogen III oxidase
VSKSAPAATNRFIYYPDHLVKLPHFLADKKDEIYNTLANEPLFENFPIELFSVLLRIRFIERDHDESIASWFTRMGAPKAAQNLISAMIHGIYAGDINKLSMNSVFPQLCMAENTYRSILYYILRRAFKGEKWLTIEEDLFIREKLQLQSPETIKSEFLHPSLKAASKSSVYTLKGGLETLVKSLVEYLNNNPNVTMYTHMAVENITQNNKKVSLLVYLGLNMLSLYTG